MSPRLSVSKILEDWKLAFDVDAMYFHAAKQNYETGVRGFARVQQAYDNYAGLEEESERVIGKYRGDTWKAYDELEPLYIQLESAGSSIGFEYAPVLEAFSTTHILCAAALETHINARSKGLLSGKSWDKFESMDLETKWLFLPKLAGLEGFDPGTEPFQSFSKLISFRNRLVHYKERTEPWKPPGVPSFLADLGLTEKLAGQSLESVRGMISGLARRLKEKQPFWLTKSTQAANYFSIQIPSKRKS